MPICETSICMSNAVLKYMRKRDLSLSKMAKLLSLPLSSVQNYCKPKVNPRVDTMELISQATGISMVELFLCGLSGEELAKSAVHFVELAAELPPDECRRVLQALSEAIDQYSSRTLS